MTNKTEVRVIGMSRSGNHAIISWILAQVRGHFCFLNCCEGKQSPFASAREMDDGHSFHTNVPGFDLTAERAGRFRPKDWLVHSYEDSFLGNVCSRTFEQNHDRWVGPTERRIDLVILRDPFNLFASRRRKGHGLISPSTATRIWKQHARQFLEGSRALAQRPLLVRYDRWVREQGYRREVAEKLGLVFSDEGVERIPACAGGSSFDGFAYDGRASGMDLFGRWRRYIDDPAYLATFDTSMLRTTRAIFGDSEAARAIQRRIVAGARGPHRAHRQPTAVPARRTQAPSSHSADRVRSTPRFCSSPRK